MPSPNLQLVTTDLAAQDVFDILAKLVPDLLKVDGALSGGSGNLLTNPGFELNQRASGPYTGDVVYGLDRWYNSTPAGEAQTVTYDTSQVADSSSAHSAKVDVTIGAGVYARLAQALEGPTTYRGRALAGRLWAKCSTANAVRAFLVSTTLGTSFSAYHPGDGAWHALDVTGTIDSAAVSVAFGADCRAAATFWVDNATLVTGTVPMNYVPLHPVVEWQRAQRYFEVARAVWGSGYAANAGDLIAVAIPWKVVKGGLPTVTKLGTWAVTNCGQPAVAAVLVDGCTLQAAATAAGPVSFTPNSTDDMVTASWNP